MQTPSATTRIPVVLIGIALLYRYLPSQPIPMKLQPFQVGEASQLRRDHSAEQIEVEDQFDNAAAVVCGYTPPFPNRSVAQPVVVVSPIVSIRRIVEGDQ